MKCNIIFFNQLSMETVEKYIPRDDVDVYLVFNMICGQNYSDLIECDILQLFIECGGRVLRDDNSCVCSYTMNYVTHAYTAYNGEVGFIYEFTYYGKYENS